MTETKYKAVDTIVIFNNKIEKVKINYKLPYIYPIFYKIINCERVEHIDFGFGNNYHLFMDEDGRANKILNPLASKLFQTEFYGVIILLKCTYDEEGDPQLENINISIENIIKLFLKHKEETQKRICKMMKSLSKKQIIKIPNPDKNIEQIEKSKITLLDTFNDLSNKVNINLQTYINNWVSEDKIEDVD